MADNTIPATVSRGLSTEVLTRLGLPPELGINLTTLPARLDDTALAAVRAIAAHPAPAFEPCDKGWFLKCMRSLAILPRKADDETKGGLRLGLYWGKLEGASQPAMSWLVERALEECSWFPSIRECKQILDTWPVPRQAAAWRDIASRKVQDELQARWHDLKERIRDGLIDEAGINALPESVKVRLDTEMVILGYRDDPDAPFHYKVRRSFTEACI